MSKSLVIVESPAKAKTINKYLGDQFIVKSSIGHIRDLPTSGSATTDSRDRAREAARTRGMDAEEKAQYKSDKARQQLVRRMGINPEQGWRADYQVLPGKEKVVAELRKLAASAPQVYLATDLDREGEAIAWHLREIIGGDDSRFRRVVFNEITKRAITEAFEQPAQLNLNRVNAQQARRFLDRVVGFMLSPLLWSKIARGLSAGRVQSVALRLLVEREREIHAFDPEEYWTLHADLQAAGRAAVRFQVTTADGEKFRPVNQAQAQAAVERLAPAEFKVGHREDRPSRAKAPAPLITSTLQQAASTRLGFGVKKTMVLAQRLYEAGHITYMRTDSTNLSEDALSDCRSYIESSFGASYLPQEPLRYGSREGAQEAHEAIRPSDVRVQPERLQDMEADARKLYQLIWQHFVACQMNPAEFTVTRVDVRAGDFDLRATGRVVRFDGFQRVLPPYSKNEDDRELPDLQVGESLQLLKLDPVQHFTKPPARYSEAALVRELEKRGIGRPSTYASIISTIQERGYVRLEKRRFYVEKIGEIVSDRLQENFQDLMDYSFTARMEENLDRIASGGQDWIATLDAFYADFVGQLSRAETSMRGNDATLTDIPCATCGRPMQIRTASTGVFLGCSGYALPPKERCKQTVNLVSGDEVLPADADEEAETRQLHDKKRCPKCHTAMDAYLMDAQRRLHVCGNNPDCDGYLLEQGEFKLKGYDGPVLECDKCGSQMQLKTGRFGKYFGCTSPDCKNTRKLLRNGQPAPPKMDPVPMPELRCEKVDDHYLLRDGASGLFLAASQYPRHRETRAPLVSELLPHQAAIDPKYAHLFSAPRQDAEGRDTVVRFDKKSGMSYVRSEVDGKPTGWRADYQDGRWVVRGD